MQTPILVIGFVATLLTVIIAAMNLYTRIVAWFDEAVDERIDERMTTVLISKGLANEDGTDWANGHSDLPASVQDIWEAIEAIREQVEKEKGG